MSSINRNDLEFTEKLGEGSFGIVFRASHKATKETFAWKMSRQQLAYASGEVLKEKLVSKEGLAMTRKV